VSAPSVVPFALPGRRAHGALHAFPTRRSSDLCTCWKQSAKMLGTAIHMMRGTPYIYQGEELGMTNAHFASIGQYRDVESLNYYQILQQQGKTPAQAMEIIQQRSRDNGRTPMQWDARSEEHTSELQSRFDLVCRL